MSTGFSRRTLLLEFKAQYTQLGNLKPSTPNWAILFFSLCTDEQNGEHTYAVNCITSFTRAKYIHQLFASLQHVSAHHRCHHQRIITVAIIMSSKWSIVSNTATQLVMASMTYRNMLETCRHRVNMFCLCKVGYTN